MSNPATILVRIRPYNPRKGAKTKSYTYRGQRFMEEAGWYEVSIQLGEELGQCTVDGQEDGERVFDVATPEQAKAMQQRERVVVETRAPAEAPMKITRTASAEAAGPRTPITINDEDPDLNLDDEDEDEETPEVPPAPAPAKVAAAKPVPGAPKGASAPKGK
jgi:hypothetical protein